MAEEKEESASDDDDGKDAKEGHNYCCEGRVQKVWICKFTGQDRDPLYVSENF